MSYKFPSKPEFRKRNCFNCKRTINIGDFYLKNKTIPEERLIELWENPRIEYYCCLCFDDLVKTETVQKIKQGLSEEENETLKILERRYHVEIPLVSEIKHDTVGFTVKSGKMSGLGMFSIGLGDLPEEILSLKSIEMLNLAWNCMKILPASISALSSLKMLDLTGNKISYISECIDQLSALEELDLSFNDLKYIPLTICSLPSLKVLKLIRNKIVRIPSTLINLEKKGIKVLL